jgi:hypothetical protein
LSDVPPDEPPKEEPKRFKIRVGRKTKLTPEFIAAVYKAVRQGMPPMRACMMYGCSEGTYKRWKSIVRDEVAKDKKDADPKHRAKVRFFLTLDAIESNSMSDLYTIVRNRAATDADMALKILEKRWPAEWSGRGGPAQRIEVSGPDGEPIAAKHEVAIAPVVVLPPEEELEDE